MAGVDLRVTSGFTLLELTIVLAVIGVLLNAVVPTTASQWEARQRNATERQITRILEASIGFAVAQGRLACPATKDTRGREQAACPGAGSHGYVPAVTLGIDGPLNDDALLVDRWGQPFRYITSAFDHPTRGTQSLPDFTSTDEAARVGMRELNSELVLCRVAAASECRDDDIRANQVPLIVFSTGHNQALSATQQENLDADSIYVTREYSRRDGLQFDDLVGWISENRFFYELVRAGTLP